MKPVSCKTIAVGGVNIFYREAGSPEKPTLLLLHGFPSSSHMFRDLIADLSDNFHLVAPDLPGFGFTEVPEPARAAHTFGNLANVIENFTEALSLSRYALYVFDYGAPVGLRLALAHPERITALISQNGNAYEEGLSDGWNPIQNYWREPSDANRAALRGFLAPETTRWQYTHGVSDPTQIPPESYTLDSALLSRPGNDEIQLDLFGDYQSNVALYPVFQGYFRTHRPPTLAVWGKNDPFFLPAGAEAFRRDNPDAEVHFFDTGHFALETHHAEIADTIQVFLQKHVAPQQTASMPSLLERVRQFYAFIATGDGGSALDLLSPDVIWTSPAGFPGIGGVHHGVAAVGENVFGRLMTDWDPILIQPDRFLSAGEGVVVVLGHYRGKHRQGNEPLLAAFTHVWEGETGKVERFTHVSDTAMVRAAALVNG